MDKFENCLTLTDINFMDINMERMKGVECLIAIKNTYLPKLFPLWCFKPMQDKHNLNTYLAQKHLLKYLPIAERCKQKLSK